MSTENFARNNDGWEHLSHGARIVAIGDIHGDLDAMSRILLGLGLVDAKGEWCGEASHLVFMGDLNDRGPDSLAVMDFVMALEQQARLSGGMVTALVGNHEMLAADGDYRYVRAIEVLELESFWYGHVSGLHAIFRGHSPWARWMRSRPTLLKIDSTLFVHAAVDAWALDASPAGINALGQGWMAHFQGVADAPDESTTWLTNDGGPFWSHRYRVGDDAAPDLESYRDVLAQILERFGVTRVVSGHVPTVALGFDIAYPHPIFGDAVALIDTGISRFYGGRLSAVEIAGNTIRPRYFERGKTELTLTQKLRARSKANLEKAADEGATAAD